jgi:dynein heavy chain 1
MENGPNIPTNVLQMSRIFMFEPSPGLFSGLNDALHSVRACKKVPAENTRLQFLLGFLHCLLVERMRYLPLGWSKGYDISEADFACATQVLEQWLGEAAAGKSNIAPQRIPWKSLRTLFLQAVYGGRIDNSFDARLLGTLLQWLFSEKVFDAAFRVLPADMDALPDGTSVIALEDWTRAISNKLQHPSWLRLPDDVDAVVQTEKGMKMYSKIR